VYPFVAGVLSGDIRKDPEVLDEKLAETLADAIASASFATAPPR
jgi:hypothetical protein